MQITPPSIAVTTLVGLSEKISHRPKTPAFRPWYSAPSPWALSKYTGTPWRSPSVGQRLDVRGEPVDVRRADRGGPRRQVPLDVGRIERQGVRPAVAEDRDQAVPHQRLRGGREREGGHDDLGARRQLERLGGQHEPRGARRHRDRLARAGLPADLLLEGASDPSRRDLALVPAGTNELLELAELRQGRANDRHQLHRWTSSMFDAGMFDAGMFDGATLAAGTSVAGSRPRKCSSVPSPG